MLFVAPFAMYMRLSRTVNIMTNHSAGTGIYTCYLYPVSESKIMLLDQKHLILLIAMTNEKNVDKLLIPHLRTLSAALTDNWVSRPP